MQNQNIEKLAARLKQIMLDSNKESFLKMAKEVLEGACDKCVEQKATHRMLKAGEILQEGDEAFVGHAEWWKVEAGNIGDAVREKHSKQYPEGYYRRPVDSEADLWKAEAERWREIARSPVERDDFARAIRWLAEGKKVRVITWNEGMWIKLVGNVVVTNCGIKYGSFDVCNVSIGGWELYQEPAEQTTEPEPTQGINIGYRLLNVGEKLQGGDEFYYPSGDWVVIEPELIGFEIQPADNFVLPAGYYRRKI